MKYLSIKQAKELFDCTDKKVSLCFKKSDLKLNQFKQYQGHPCIMKVDKDNLNYIEALEYTDDEPFMVSFRCKELPDSDYVVVCVEDKLVDGESYSYYPFKVRPLSSNSIKIVEEAQKDLDVIKENREKIEGEPYEF